MHFHFKLSRLILESNLYSLLHRNKLPFWDVKNEKFQNANFTICTEDHLIFYAIYIQDLATESLTQIHEKKQYLWKLTCFFFMDFSAFLSPLSLVCLRALIVSAVH